MHHRNIKNQQKNQIRFDHLPERVVLGMLSQYSVHAINAINFPRIIGQYTVGLTLLVFPDTSSKSTGRTMCGIMPLVSLVLPTECCGCRCLIESVRSQHVDKKLAAATAAAAAAATSARLLSKPTRPSALWCGRSQVD